MDTSTVSGVEIVSTGTYELGSGTTTFTEQHLRDAVLAQSDPAVVAPRIKLGHTDKRFNPADLDAEPAFGTVANMRLANSGHSIVADLVDVPRWLADSMSSAFPGRSIEGGFDFTSPSGHEYSLVISNLGLLGTTWPGVTSLDDLREVLEANGSPVPAPVEADGGYRFDGGRAGSFVVAKLANATVKAGIDLGTVPRVFVKDVAAGKVPTIDDVGEQGKWWARNVQAEEDGSLTLLVDDEAGHILRLPVKVDGEKLSYSTPELVEVATQKLAASGETKGPRVIASWPKTAGRPEQEAHIMDVPRDVLIKRLGLAEDSDEAQITAALAAAPEDGSGDGEGDGEGEGEGSERLAASAGRIPTGMVLVDAKTLDEVKAGAAKGSSVAAKLDEQERDKAIEFAVTDGRIAAAQRERFETLWDKDREGTEKLLTAKAEEGGLASVIPTGQRELGHAGDGEGDPQAEDVAVASFQRRFFPELVTSNGQGA